MKQFDFATTCRVIRVTDYHRIAARNYWVSVKYIDLAPEKGWGLIDSCWHIRPYLMVGELLEAAKSVYVKQL